VWFGVASLLCGLAPDVRTLIAARVLQGVGGALLTPGSLALLQASFAPSDRGRVIGAWSGLGSVAAGLGPFLGGLVLELSWRLVFLLNVPLCAAVVVVALRHVPESRDPDAARSVDVAGAVLGALGLAGVTYALIALGEDGRSGLAAVTGGAGVLLLVAFVLVERRLREPLLPPASSPRGSSRRQPRDLPVYAALSGFFLLVVVHLQVVAGLAARVRRRAGADHAAHGRAVEPLGAWPPPRPAAADDAGPLLMAARCCCCRASDRASYVVEVLPGCCCSGWGSRPRSRRSPRRSSPAAPTGTPGWRPASTTPSPAPPGCSPSRSCPVAAGIGGTDYQDPERFAPASDRVVPHGRGCWSVGGLLAAVSVSDDVVGEPVDEDAPPA
jgi:hypothetical protein